MPTLTSSLIYPPRPEKAIDPSELPRYENLGWIAQMKANGTCSVVETGPEGLVYTRHREPHRSWNPQASRAMEPLRELNPGTTLVAELLHSKVSGGHKDTLYVFDIVTLEGEDLFGETLRDRLKALYELLQPQDDGHPYWVRVNDNLWVTRVLRDGFQKTFESLKDPEHEGLVLKNPQARLLSCARPSENSRWQVKVRRPHLNYSF